MLEFSRNNYYPFGMVMPGRSFADTAYRFGFNGMEKDGEIKGEGNSYDFGARIYDPRIGRFLSIDRLCKELPNQAPYVLAGNNSIYYIDVAGNFKISYDEVALKEVGITKEQIVRFEAIIQNIENIVKDNPTALEVLSKSTGFSKDQILKDLKYGEGPTININNIAVGAYGDKNGMQINAAMIANLENMSTDNPDALAKQVLGMAILTLHEYTHYGDQQTNDGKYSGEWNQSGNRAEPIVSDNSILFGKEEEGQWKTSPTGHRGKDTEIFGYGVSVSINGSNSEVSVLFNYTLPTRWPVDLTNFPSPPTELPENMQGISILTTLDVE